MDEHNSATCKILMIMMVEDTAYGISCFIYFDLHITYDPNLSVQDGLAFNAFMDENSRRSIRQYNAHILRGGGAIVEK